MKTAQKKYIVAIIVLVALGLAIYLFYPRIEKVVRCPDAWHQLRWDVPLMKSRDSFRIRGKGVSADDMKREDVIWIKENCDLRPIPIS